jgi:hypothetical protein
VTGFLLLHPRGRAPAGSSLPAWTVSDEQVVARDALVAELKEAVNSVYFLLFCCTGADHAANKVDY